MTKEQISKEFQNVQDFICKELERVDGTAVFQQDLWSRDGGGGGRTRVIKEGNVIEKGGVNFSEVHGEITPLMKSNTEIRGESFFATGVSIVLHPNSPHIPIIHMNIRYFETDEGVYWFGGGIDLTPHYIVPNQAKMFHQSLKEICDKYQSSFYPEFKKWADDYFFIPHRNETRGIGGIFFDHQKASEKITQKELLSFCLDLGKAFPFLYEEQVVLGKNKEVLSAHKDWMRLRRGRYVEFNLVNDRGTKFGLVSNGRTESILMSLPPLASWEYSFTPKENSLEEKTISLLKKEIDWVSF